MMWYKKIESVEHQGVLPLIFVKSITSTLFGSSTFSVNTISKDFIFKCQDEEEKRKWLFSIQQWIASLENIHPSEVSHLQKILNTERWWKKLSNFEEKKLSSHAEEIMPKSSHFYVKFFIFLFFLF